MKDGQGGRYDVTTNQVLIPGVGGSPNRRKHKTQVEESSARLAIALRAKPKGPSFRAGYGRSYFQGTFGWTFNNLADDVYPIP